MQSEDAWNRAALDAFEQSFEASWVFVGFTREAARPESWFVYEAGPRSLIVCRDAAGRLGAFVNSCSHRGTRLCSKAGSGRIQCPYHGWVFDTGGRLRGATKRAGLPEFDDSDYGLVPLALSLIGDLIFVHGEAAPTIDLRVQLGESYEALERLRTPLSGAALTGWSDPRPWQEALTTSRVDEAISGGQVYPLPPNALLIEREEEATLLEVCPRSPNTSRTRRWRAHL